MMTKLPSEPCQEAGDDRAHQKRPTSRGGPRSPWLCATCRRAKASAQRRSAGLKRLGRVYGLSETDMDALRGALPLGAAGRRVCPGCMRATGATKALAVDHDHDRERRGVPMRATVRGILCGPCNQLIGRFSIEALERLIEYQRNPPAPPILGTQEYW